MNDTEILSQVVRQANKNEHGLKVACLEHTKTGQRFYVLTKHQLNKLLALKDYAIVEDE